MNNPNIIGSVIEVIKSNRDQINALMEEKEGMPFADAATIYLMDKFGYTQIQASEICEELKKGLDDYTARQAAEQTDDSALIANIEEATAGYSPEERKIIYVNVLTSMQLVSDPDADIDELKGRNSALNDDELVAAIVAALDGLPFQYVMENLKDGITPENIALLGEAKDMKSEQFKLAAALMLYVAQKEDAVKLSDNDAELDPRTIGALAGAGADAMAATLDLQDGKIDLSAWQLILKGIVRALFSVAFAAICTYAIISINAFIASAIFSIFGFGLTAVLIALPAIYYFTKSAIKSGEEEHAKLVDRLSPLFDSLIVKLPVWANKVIEKVKGWMQVIREKAADIKSKVKAPKQPETENTDSIEAEPALI